MVYIYISEKTCSFENLARILPYSLKTLEMKQGILRIIPRLMENFPETGRLAVNRDGVYNIPNNEEDCAKSAAWFSNKLVECLITEPFEIGKALELHETAWDIDANLYIVADAAFFRDVYYKKEDNYERVLVRHDEIPLSTLEAIVNKELFNGDYVDVAETRTFTITKTAKQLA